MQVEDLASSMGPAADFGDSHPTVLWNVKARQSRFATLIGQPMGTRLHRWRLQGAH